MGWLDVIGWAGSALLVWSLVQSRLLHLRLFNLVGCVVLLGYNLALRVWPMVGLNLVLAGINLWYLVRHYTTRHDGRRYEVVELGADDGFLGHVLRVHGRDIARFNPGFTGPADLPGRTALLVMCGDEVVGVVLLRTVDDGVAQIELDYVTRKYRDLTPGEFVFHRSGVLAGRGLRRVVTRPGMLEPYYDRLGFRPHGDAYALDL
jgi:hypothetical protein